MAQARIRKGRPMAWVLGIAGAWGVLTLVMVLLSWRRPDLGLVEERLRPCGERPNCVCSQDAKAGSAIEPLAFEGDAKEAFARLKDFVGAMPRATLVEDGEQYLRFEFRTRLLRYADDVEFALDARADVGVIHVRSASRVGYSDMGTNRTRVEAIRTRFGGERTD